MYRNKESENHMFRIPNFYQDEVSFQEGWKAMTDHGRGDTLEGMEAMNRCWEEHCASGEEDDEFFENYEYEVNAYNAVFSNMQPMFA
tara:strand:- start:313 stop:573 length:261 start_codon:yes stop_codon:yes gene_type:complete